MSPQLDTDIWTPEGSILRRPIFLIFINGLPNLITESHIVMYEDDTSINSDRSFHLIQQKIERALN